MLASLDMPAFESGTIRRLARWNEAERSDCNATALERVVSTIGLCSNPAAGLDFNERYLAGGRSGLSAHLRAAGSRSGSSSQTRQT